jgi:Ca2+-binding RTX toxin-like protein
VSGRGNDVVRSVEDAEGSFQGDVLIGNDADNVFEASEGDDHVEGGVGDDELWGDTGNDELDGGPDTDGCFSGETLVDCEFTFARKA